MRKLEFRSSPPPPPQGIKDSWSSSSFCESLKKSSVNRLTMYILIHKRGGFTEAVNKEHHLTVEIIYLNVPLFPLQNLLFFYLNRTPFHMVLKIKIKYKAYAKKLNTKCKRIHFYLYFQSDWFWVFHDWQQLILDTC